ncbi:apolipoprotein N-acyltransferase [Rubritalea squalenifaciens DSM 18772]|uniref:Apolipoprotein N-acyltransferase n=1 Tax=Rubritalea squalenifaciens DSM 18772 TaxID=1123071 RepID=A0A1M6DY45_9BACT|nr:apolipoprotein N-acyltransferase [Rubritalea squalenifaciens]SHI78073.1 apolipoprotein N-acyltransferase [Rubritalea squalenifaciens DSM 18772]
MKIIKKLWPLVMAMLSGTMLAACFPGFISESWLVWLWILPLMLALWLGGGEKKRKRYGFGVGFVAGLTFWLINLKWLIAMGELDTVPLGGAMFGWACLSLYLSLYFGFWGMFAASLGNPWRGKRVSEGEKISSNIEKKLSAKAEKKEASGFTLSLRVLQFSFMNASFWVVLEWLRGWLMTGFGWNGLGVAFYDVLVMAQAADLIGVTGLSFFPVMIGASVLQTGKRMAEELKVGRFKPHWEIGVSMGIIAVTFAYGVNRMSHFSNVPTKDVSVLLVQENIKQQMKWDEMERPKHYDGYEKSTVQALEKLEQENTEAIRKQIESGDEGELVLKQPDLIIYPESSLTQELLFLKDEEGVYLLPENDRLLTSDFMKQGNHHLVFGSNLVRGKEYPNGGIGYDPEANEIYNALAIATPDLKKETVQPAKSIKTYGKNHLVIFGEYIPKLPLLNTIMEMSSGASFGSNFSKGGVTDPIDIKVRGDDLQIIPSVCFEDTVGRLERKFVRTDAPQLMVNITNDGWFGTSEAAMQQMANAKFRTVELRRPMARSANTGVSCVIDMVGSLMNHETGKRNMVEDETGNHFIKGTLFAQAKVPVNPEWTVYAIAGDWFVIACTLLFLALAFVTLKKA